RADASTGAAMPSSPQSHRQAVNQAGPTSSGSSGPTNSRRTSTCSPALLPRGSRSCEPNSATRLQPHGTLPADQPSSPSHHGGMPTTSGRQPAYPATQLPPATPLAASHPAAWNQTGYMTWPDKPDTWSNWPNVRQHCNDTLSSLSTQRASDSACRQQRSNG